MRELIADGLIAPGDVDDRSITDVSPADLVGYTQCHFFAGIGGWSLALRLAGWPDDRPVWTGSCPCQPYSLAGARKGSNDPRDLWPAFMQRIRQRRPVAVFGEQVEGAIRWGWLDRLCDDMEAEGYSVGATVFPASAVGALHRRDRCYWAASANTDGIRLQGVRQGAEGSWSWEQFEGLVQAELRVAVPAGALGGLSLRGPPAGVNPRGSGTPSSRKRAGGGVVRGGPGLAGPLDDSLRGV
ncbi:MAG: DNA cytosine methyltransferase [Gemmatimonadetes bacterium]|nr:DNA cytosine methyltransferase [Gemmatimonadota bacterium]